MPNILTVPNSGSIFFSDDTVGSSLIPTTDESISLNYSNTDGLRILGTNETDKGRFHIDGENGRLFSVSDSLTGIIFSVNDAAGLPILEIESDTSDIVRIGTFGSDALTISDDLVQIGSEDSNIDLEVNGNITANNLVYTSGEQTIDGEKTFTDNIAFIGENNTMPNQVLSSDGSILTRQTKVFDDIFRHSMRYRSFPLGGATRDGGNNVLNAGGIVGFISSSAQSAAIINMAENWISNDEDSDASIPFNNPFILHSVYTFYLTNNTNIIERVYVGHDGNLNNLPWSGEDPVPPYRRSIGFEVRRIPSTNITEIRLFARDGIFGVSEGTMVFSDWSNLIVSASNLNTLSGVVLEHDPLNQSIKIYHRSRQATTAATRLNTEPNLILSGVGVPVTQEDSGPNWNKIIGAIVADNINTQGATAQALLIREVNIEFL